MRAMTLPKAHPCGRGQGPFPAFGDIGPGPAAAITQLDDADAVLVVRWRIMAETGSSLVADEYSKRILFRHLHDQVTYAIVVQILSLPLSKRLGTVKPQIGFRAETFFA